MRSLITVTLAALLIGCGSSASAPPSARAPGRPAKPPAEALSNLHHPVTTNSEAAQRHFDDGLTQVYAFNHDEAIRCFERALKADPNLAMAHWGIALAVGPNYNIDVDEAREKQGYEEIQKAIELSKTASPAEQEYINTLAKRFSNAEKPDLKQIAQDYAAAAGELSKKYPDDLDAATLYAEAMMDLRPWKLWTLDYKPEPGTETIVATLQSVLKRDPDHIGANHLYIHAVEASFHPEMALESAARLPVLAPSCGHLVHMPSHIYARVGDHESAVTSNEAAVDVDREFFKKTPEGKGGPYEMVYYPHNMHFIAYGAAWGGNYAEAKKWAQAIYDHAQPHVEHMAMLEMFTVVPEGINVKFRKWDDILAMKEPDEKTMPNTAALWHFARGMAFAGKGDYYQARYERDKMTAIEAKMPPDAMMSMLNKSHQVLDIARNVLDGKIAAQQKNYSEAIKALREAVALEDGLVYMEPPDWLSPTRESLGGVLLLSGDAAGAEKAFRESLDRMPRNARALFGLEKALAAQGKTYEASIIHKQFETAWKNADTKLTVEDL
jgi:tetratricopeptide (TPR) repeat protein